VSDIVNVGNYGLLSTGFARMRFPEIRQQIIDTLQQKTGVTFETRTDSITGQFIDTFAEREATLWELAEAVYHAMYPNSATGVNLDNSVSFAGVRRLFAERSTAWCACYGVETTVIPAGSIIRNNSTQDNFLLDKDVTISRQRTIDATMQVMDAIEGNQYWIEIDTSMHLYIAVAGDTTTSIAEALYAKMLSPKYVVSADANNIRIYGIESIPFALQMSTNISLLQIGTPGDFTAEAFGPNDISVNSLTTIVTTMTGWTGVNNVVEGHMGRNLETDDELRLRYDRGVFRLGATTLDAIRSNILQNVQGIMNCQVYENQEDTVDADGRPPHSIEVIAYGGNPEDIANQIWLLKAAGIDTFGSVTVNIIDSINVQHAINFNRATPVYIWVNIAVSLYNEEIFPDNGISLIQTIVTNTGNTFGIGKDVITQRFYGPIYAGVSGIGKMDITVAKMYDPDTAPQPTDYTDQNIPISPRELSTFIETHVSVSILS
jgi:uncharacterized phage protein gp47/JayE